MLPITCTWFELSKNETGDQIKSPFLSKEAILDYTPTPNPYISKNY
jgi:hypothetical protein